MIDSLRVDEHRGLPQAGDSRRRGPVIVVQYLRVFPLVHRPGRIVILRTGCSVSHAVRCGRLGDGGRRGRWLLVRYAIVKIPEFHVTASQRRQRESRFQFRVRQLRLSQQLVTGDLVRLLLLESGGHGRA